MCWMVSENLMWYSLCGCWHRWWLTVFDNIASIVRPYVQYQSGLLDLESSCIWTFCYASVFWNRRFFFRWVLLKTLSARHAHKLEALLPSHTAVRFPRRHIQKDTRTCIPLVFLLNLVCICRNGNSRYRKGNIRAQGTSGLWYSQVPAKTTQRHSVAWHLK